MLHGQHEFKGTHHEHDRTGTSKKLPDLDGSMGRRADRAAACAGRELTAAPARSIRIFLLQPGEPRFQKLHPHPSDESLLFLPKLCSHPKELHMLAKCANPSCSTPLVYPREGKIFMVESPQSQTDK